MTELAKKSIDPISLILGAILASLVMIGFAPSAEAAGNDDEFHLTYDLSGSIGKTGGRDYQEVSLGLNAHFNEWLVWRNAGFGRFVSGSENVYGLDTSGRFVLDLGDSKLGLNAFIGPGYRFTTTSGNAQADSAPFAEGGLTLKLGGLRIGGGIKTVFNSVVRPGAAEDTQYFLILGGGGVL